MGSYSELAAYEFFSSRASILPCETFEALFDAVQKGQADFGMAPAENSLVGSIHPVWDLLVERGLPIAGEVRMRIVHCLLGHPGARLQDIRRVLSHPQALAQCQEYLSGLEDAQQEEVYDTAGAVKIIRKRGEKTEAAIASAQAAVDYGMEVLAESIQTHNENFTRFLVLSQQARHFDGKPLKTTLVLSLTDAARNLPAVLDSLTRRNVDLLMIDSHKRRGHPWEHLYYLEFRGSPSDPGQEAALQEIARQVGAMNIIGTYPPGRTCEARLHRRRPNSSP